MKNGSGGQTGLETSLKVIQFDGIDYVFDLDDTYLKVSIGKTFKQQYEGLELEPTDIHTTLQYKICSVAVAAGYKIFVSMFIILTPISLIWWVNIPSGFYVINFSVIVIDYGPMFYFLNIHR